MYNTVKVTLSNPEFGELSTKELEVATYLDRISQVHLVNDDHRDEAITLKQIFDIS